MQKKAKGTALAEASLELDNLVEILRGRKYTGKVEVHLDFKDGGLTRVLIGAMKTHAILLN